MKKIGILSWRIGENSFGITLPYLYYFSMFGSISPIHYAEEPRNDLDLLVVPGGPDIDSSRYGQAPDLTISKACPFREYFDMNVLPEYIQQGTPIFGICRGLQTIAVHFGASLIQNMYHETNPADERAKLVHTVLYQEAGKENVNWSLVNSIHHQAVDNEGFPSELAIIGRYLPKPKDKHVKVNNIDLAENSIEAIVHKELPIAAVQFHPEELYNSIFANKLVELLLEEPASVNNYFVNLNEEAEVLHG